MNFDGFIFALFKISTKLSLKAVITAKALVINEDAKD